MTWWLWLLAYLAFSPMLGLLVVLIVALGGPIKTKLADLRQRSSLRGSKRYSASQHEQVTLAHASVSATTRIGTSSGTRRSAPRPRRAQDDAVTQQSQQRTPERETAAF
jgi:hypothetical protein